jgi:hypothetical protein
MLRCLGKKVYTLVLILLKKRNQNIKNIKAMKISSLKKIILAHLETRINKNMINILNHHLRHSFPKGIKKTQRNKNLLIVNHNKKSLNTNLDLLSIN